VGAAITDVLRASAGKDAPLRIIGATMTGSAKYWYVAAASPIKAAKDISGRSIGYAKAGQYDVFDFMDRYRIKARPVLGGGEIWALDQVTAGKLDVGWATPPFGVDALEQGRIRVVAKANDVPAIRDKTVGVMIASADTLQKRYEVLVRFLQAYRETLDWMYSDPAAAKAYAEFAGVPDALALRLRGEFFTREMLSPDKIVGLSAVAKDATKTRTIPAAMSKKQLDELVQLPSADRAKATARSSGWFRILSPRSP
jgi:NitT/TauT family transport system substrate-binding protein